MADEPAAGEPGKPFEPRPARGLAAPPRVTRCTCHKSTDAPAGSDGCPERAAQRARYIQAARQWDYEGWQELQEAEILPDEDGLE
ncbi:hypothetical protein P3T29_002114 [Kitasatospora sp. MAP5-34]|nr:hypothetical protein [Kitasatospora sp. MAP5-34]